LRSLDVDAFETCSSSFDFYTGIHRLGIPLVYTGSRNPYEGLSTTLSYNHLTLTGRPEEVVLMHKTETTIACTFQKIGQYNFGAIVEGIDLKEDQPAEIVQTIKVLPTFIPNQ
jgi:hypothetical protein